MISWPVIIVTHDTLLACAAPARNTDGESSHARRNRDCNGRKKKPGKSQGEGADRDGFASAAVQFTDVVVVPPRAHPMAGRTIDGPGDWRGRGWCAPTPILLGCPAAGACGFLSFFRFVRLLQFQMTFDATLGLGVRPLPWRQLRRHGCLRRARSHWRSYSYRYLARVAS